MKLSPPLTAVLGTLSLASLGNAQSDPDTSFSASPTSNPGSTENSIAAQPPVVPSDYTCNHPPYRVQIVSTSPLLLYLRGFLTETETRYLKGYSEATLPPTDASKNRKGQDGHSNSPTVESNDITRCLQDRLLELQGYDMERTHVEPVRIVHAQSLTGVMDVDSATHVDAEVDWFSATDTDTKNTAVRAGGNRVSSLLAWVGVSRDTTGGGVNFPLVDAPRDERWCDVVECDVPWEAGVTFRAVQGNAIYWRDLNESGHGDRRVARAAVPLTGGEEVSVNMWTRQGMLVE